MRDSHITITRKLLAEMVAELRKESDAAEDYDTLTEVEDRITALKIAIKFLDEEYWVNQSFKKPPRWEKVIVTDCNVIGVAFYSDDRWWFENGHPEFEITHWRPMIRFPRTRLIK